jgi:hypothetical protein
MEEAEHMNAAAVAQSSNQQVLQLTMRYAVLVTMGLPASSVPPSTQVTQVGSPANSSLYSGVRSCLQEEQHNEKAEA